MLFTKIERALDTVDFTITSNTAIGKEIRFSSATRTYSHIVTTLPETVVMTVETSTGIVDFKDYVVEIYDAGVLYQTYNNVTFALQNYPSYLRTYEDTFLFEMYDTLSYGFGGGNVARAL